MPQSERPFTPETLADRWQCSAQTIRDLCKSGALPHFRVGRMFRIRVDAVEAYEQEQEERASQHQPPSKSFEPVTCRVTARKIALGEVGASSERASRAAQALKGQGKTKG